MKNRNSSPAQNVEELLQDLRALISEAEGLAASSIQEHSAEALEAMQARFEAAQEKMADIYAGTRRKITAGARYTDETIRAHPYQSLALGAGIGLLVGILLGRSSNK
ncbi:MAG: hypothetical protein ABI273_03930 [Lacunisphaera sp.]